MENYQIHEIWATIHWVNPLKTYDNLALKFFLVVEFLLDVIIKVIDKEIWDMTQNGFGRFRWIHSTAFFVFLLYNTKGPAVLAHIVQENTKYSRVRGSDQDKKNSSWVKEWICSNQRGSRISKSNPKIDPGKKLMYIVHFIFRTKVTIGLQSYGVVQTQADMFSLSKFDHKPNKSWGKINTQAVMPVQIGLSCDYMWL